MLSSQIQEDKTDHYAPKMSTLPRWECRHAPLSLEAHPRSCCPESHLLKKGQSYNAVVAQRRDWVLPFIPTCFHMELSSRAMPSLPTFLNPETLVISYPRVNVEMSFSSSSWYNLVRLLQCGLVVSVVFWYISSNLGHFIISYWLWSGCHLINGQGLDRTEPIICKYVYM